MKDNEIVTIFLHDEPRGDVTYLSFRKPAATTTFDEAVRTHVEAARAKAGAGARDWAWVDRFIGAMENRGYSIISSDFAWAMNGERVSMLGCHVPEDHASKAHRR